MDPKKAVLTLWNLQPRGANLLFSRGIHDPRYSTSRGGIIFYVVACLGAVVMVRSTAGVV